MKLTRLLATAGLFWLGAAAFPANAQVAASPCGNCINIAPDGDMMLIPTSGQGYLNTFGLNWHSSHGSPSYNPGSLWMWSYYNGGEGIYYDGVTFQAGHTYCVTFDTQTKTHDLSAPVADAGFNVIATNGMVPYETPSGGSGIPAVPTPSQVVASQPWSPLPNPGSTTFQYVFTASGTWSQLWIYPHSSDLPQVELTLLNLRICDITPVVTNPCEFQMEFSWKNTKCMWNFTPYVYLGPGLTAIQYNWNFGDGTSSSEMTPSHYYTSPGIYVVTLSVLVINSDGECCVRTMEREVRVEKVCDPCKIVEINDFDITNQNGLTVTYTATIPDVPGFAYVWDFGDGNTGTGHSATNTYGSPGWYLVSMTTYYYDAKAQKCCHFTRYKEVYIDENGAQTQLMERGTRTKAAVEPMPESLKERPSETKLPAPVEIFPNPSTDRFTVSSKNSETITTVQIYDLKGRLIKIVDVNGISATIDLGDEPTGTYELKITLKNGQVYNSKLIRK